MPLIAFRGTDNLENGLQDLAAVATTSIEVYRPGHDCVTVKVASGFQHALSKLEPDTLAAAMTEHSRDGSTWVVTGHSLGGAMASLFALHCVKLGRCVKLVTFGAPHVGCSSFESELNKIQQAGMLQAARLVNAADPVPYLLGPFGFCHPCDATVLDFGESCLHVFHTFTDFVSTLVRRRGIAQALQDVAVRDHRMVVYLDNVLHPLTSQTRGLARVVGTMVKAAELADMPLPEGIVALGEVLSDFGKGQGSGVAAAAASASLCAMEAPISEALTRSVGVSAECGQGMVRMLAKSTRALGSSAKTPGEKTLAIVQAGAEELVSYWMAKRAGEVLNSVRLQITSYVSSFIAECFREIKAWWSGQISGMDCAKNMFGAFIETGCGAAGAFGGAWAVTALCTGLMGPMGWFASSVACLVGAAVGGAAGTFMGKKLRGWYHDFFGGGKHQSLRTAYRELGISESASDEEVRKAYYGLARRCHPDKGGNKEEFQQLQTCYAAVMADRGRAAPADDLDPAEMNATETRAIEDSWDFAAELERDRDELARTLSTLPEYMQLRKMKWLEGILQEEQKKRKSLESDICKAERRLAYKTLGLKEGCSEEEIRKT